jgi:hypothetical protein
MKAALSDISFLSILSVLKGAAKMAYSDLPAVYQITDKLFYDRYKSKTLDATQKKFGVYAAIIEVMVRRRILGWEYNMKADKEGLWGFSRMVDEVVGADSNGYERYFKGLNITAEEISEAVEILEEGKPDHEWRAAGNYDKNNVYVRRNRYGALRVDGEGNGEMWDCEEQEREFRPWVSYAKKSLIIKGNVTKIGKRAFKDCRELSSVTIRNGVRIIGESAFEDCAKLTSITIPASVRMIGNYAFWGCGLTDVICMGSLPPELGNNAFPKGTVSLSLYVAEEHYAVYEKKLDYEKKLKGIKNQPEPGWEPFSALVKLKDGGIL